MVRRLATVDTDDGVLYPPIKLPDSSLPSRLAEAAMATAFSRNPVAAYAGTGRTKSFDATRSIYNPESKHLNLMRGHITGATMLGTRIELFLMGHSYLAGSNATPGVTDTGSVVKRLLAQRTGGAVRSAVSAFRNGEVRDSHYTNVSAGWGTSNGANLSLYGISTTNGDTLTYTSTETGTEVIIATSNNSGGFTYAIDGAAAVAVNVLDAGSDPWRVRRIVVSGLADTTHTVVITKTATTTTALAGIGVGAASGVDLYNFGYGGSITSQWTGLISGDKRSIATSSGVTRDVVLLQMDTNDWRTGAGNLTGAQWKTNMGTIISSHTVLGHSVGLILSPDAPNNLPAGRWDEYALAAFELAEQFDLPVLDTRHLLAGSFAKALTAGLTHNDSLHLNTKGYAQVAAGIVGMLVR